MTTFRIGWTTGGLVSLALSVAIAPLATGQTIGITTPAAAANADGNAEQVPGTDPIRIQHLILASDFANLPASHRTIVAFNFRSDRTQTQSLDWGGGDEMVWMSTTPLNTLTNVFDNNHGADRTLVHDGPLPFRLLTTGPANGRKDVAPGPRLDTPFYYDPSKGNLLVDRLTFQTKPSARATIDTHNTPQARILLHSGNPNNPTGEFTLEAAVLRFEFVPEPSTLVLASLALIGFGAQRWKSRRFS